MTTTSPFCSANLVTHYAIQLYNYTNFAIRITSKFCYTNYTPVLLYILSIYPHVAIPYPHYEWFHLVAGLEHFLFFHIFGRIIPTDFHIFQRVQTTNLSWFRLCLCQTPLVRQKTSPRWFTDSDRLPLARELKTAAKFCVVGCHGSLWKVLS